MNQKFTACLVSNNGKLELHVSSQAGLNILGTRHERPESGERFPQVVRDFHQPENADNIEIAIAALNAVQGFFDNRQNNPKFKKKK